MDALEILENAKNIWAAAHEIGAKLAEKSTAGKVYLLVQGSAGGAIVDTASGDSLDEQLVSFGGDVVGGFAASFIPGGWVVNVGLIATGNSVGDKLKAYYKTIKSDIVTQYWKYEKDFYYMKAGQMLHLDYAKVLYDRNGPIFDLGDQVVQASYEVQYNQYLTDKNSILNYVDTSVLNTKIENSNGVLKVTLPDGTIYAQGDGLGNTLIGGNKQDYLQGGTGYDTYIAGNGDTIEDSDGNGRVFFNNSLLTGGEWDPDKHVYVGDGGTYTKTANGYQFTTSNGETLSLNIPNGSLGFKFSGAPGDDPLPDASGEGNTHGNPDEDFSSPLVLDLNHDNTLSTSLYNSQTYFDMDGDGFVEKSAWIQEGDGLLALDRNANGTRKKIKQEITMAFGNEYVKRRKHVA